LEKKLTGGLNQINQSLKLYILFLTFSLSTQEAPIKPGIIIVLNGITSSGKSTLAQNLIEILCSEKFESKWLKLSLDDENPGTDDFDIDPNELVINKLQSISNKGINIIYDTVLLNDYINNFFSKLNKNNCKTYSIFVHCPISEIFKRLNLRNEKALTSSSSIQDKLEIRKPFQVTHQIFHFYKFVNKSDINSIETINKNITLQDIETNLNKEYPVHNNSLKKPLLKRKLSDREIDMEKNRIESSWQDIDDTEVGIALRYKYSLIVDTTHKDAVEIIITYLNNWLK